MVKSSTASEPFWGIDQLAHLEITAKFTAKMYGTDINTLKGREGLLHTIKMFRKT